MSSPPQMIKQKQYDGTTADEKKKQLEIILDKIVSGDILIDEVQAAKYKEFFETRGREKNISFLHNSISFLPEKDSENVSKAMNRIDAGEGSGKDYVLVVVALAYLYANHARFDEIYAKNREKVDTAFELATDLQARKGLSKTEKKMPKIVMTAKQVMNSIGIGYCSSELATSILKSDNPQQQIREIVALIELLKKELGDDAPYAFEALQINRIKDFFKVNGNQVIAAFKQIKHNCGEHVWSAFGVLQNEMIAELFVQNPEKVVELFREISNATQTDTNLGDIVFGVLQKKNAARLVKKYPDEIIQFIKEVSKSEKKAADDATASMLKDEVTELYEKHREEFGDIEPEATGELVADALEMLMGPNIERLFEKNPKYFVTMAKESGEDIIDVLETLKDKKVAKEFENDPETVMRRILADVRTASK